MKKLKIALYTSTFPPKLGGIATSNYNLYHLLKTHYDIKLFVYNDTINNKNVIYSKTPRFVTCFIQWLASIYLKKFDKNDQFKTCKTIIRFGVKIFFLNKSLKQFNPDIILVSDNDIPAYFLKKTSKAKLIWLAHNNYQRFQNQVLCPTISQIDNEVACSMERNAVKKADAIISPSRYMVGVCKETLNVNIPMYVVNNIILKDVINLLSKEDLYTILNIKSDYPLIYIPSAGSKIKGRRYVYEIVRQLTKHAKNKIGFYLSGPLPSELKFELSLIKNAHIYSPGHIEWEENISNIKSCTICISPNIIENYSNALLEAQTVQIPVVAFDTGGNKEIVLNNKTGFIVPHLDIDQLISKSKLIIDESDIYTKFKDNCISSINTIANQEVILANYKSIFQKVLNEH